jgi:RNA polymerase sigma-70 factor (ECF subfamily)
MDGHAALARSTMTVADHGGAGERTVVDRESLAQHYGWLRAVARNLVRDPGGAEDVTQETLLAALAAPPREVHSDQRLRAWLGRVAFNLSRLDARAASRRRAREERAARREALPSVSEELEAAGGLSALWSAIGELPEPYRAVILMRYFDGLSTAAIAARCGVSELAVRKRLWRARAKLRARLEHDPRRGRFLAMLLAEPWIARGARAKGLAGLAAGLALCAGAAFLGTDGERGGSVDPARPTLAAAGRAELGQGSGPRPADEPGVRSSAPSPRTPLRRPFAPFQEGEPPPVVQERGPRLFSCMGVVVDLEGSARGGLALVDPRAPEETLATSDPSGGFHLSLREPPPEIEARGPGWTTVVRARFARRGASRERPVVVAEAADLAGIVLDESGGPVPEARFSLRCEEAAFARVPWPIRLESAELRRFRADAGGRFEARELPRGAGLALAVEAHGFERLELDSRALDQRVTLVLRRALAPELLAGTVRHRDGRPVAGAVVRLGGTSTIADADGRFRMPLRDVASDATLSAMDSEDDAAPVQLFRFGARLRDGLERDRHLDLVLGEELDRVEGRLLGSDTEGWLVAAFSSAGGELDEDGRERPAAVVRAAADGAFALRLARGSYDLYALADDELRVARYAALGTHARVWELEQQEGGPLAPLAARVLARAGRELAAARVGVLVHLDGPGGRRRIEWKELAADERGAFAFARDPVLELELALAHPEAEARSFPGGSSSAPMALVLEPPSFVQVSFAQAESCAVLDGEGRRLVARGPLRTAERFMLSEGASPVLEVPSAARWLELERAGEAALRVPIQPRAGEILELRP